MRSCGNLGLRILEFRALGLGVSGLWFIVGFFLGFGHLVFTVLRVLGLRV